MQNQFSPIYTETADTLDYCGKVGLSFVCWSPLGGFRKPKDESKFDPFREVAEAHGVSYQQVVLAWELAKGSHVFVIPVRTAPPRYSTRSRPAISNSRRRSSPSSAESGRPA